MRGAHAWCIFSIWVISGWAQRGCTSNDSINDAAHRFHIGIAIGTAPERRRRMISVMAPPLRAHSSDWNARLTRTHLPRALSCRALA